jgi:hypothetical protein
VSLLPANFTGPWRVCWVGFGWWRTHPNQTTWAVRDEFLDWDFLRTPGIVVAPDGSAEYEKWWSERPEHGFVLPTRRAGEDGNLPRARYLDAHSVDFEAARSWIKECENLHGDGCRGSHGAIEGLRVVDCRSRTVVPAPKDCQYVVLSYYRSASHAATSQVMPDWDAVPPLFRDCITAASDLGYDYVWIDQYCTPQYESNQKERQARHVDRVYSEADLVIIAACSDDTSAGLAGTETRARQPSVSATVGDVTLVAIHSKEMDSVFKSKWHTHGFGYERSLLAHRRLLYTEHGLLFQCNGESYKESYAVEAFDIPLGSPNLRAFTSTPIVFQDVRFADKFPDIVWQMLKTYTKKLQQDQDDESVFTGILNRLASISEEFDHVWGLPVYQRPVQLPIASGIISVLQPKVTQTYSERLASSLVWEAADSSSSSTGFISSEDYNIRNLDLGIAIETSPHGRIPLDDYFSQPAASRPKLGKGLYFNGPVTFIDLGAPHENNGWYIPVTSFERNYTIQIRHGLAAFKTWDPDMQPGRYLTLILGASQASMSSWLTYHLLVLKEKDGYYERGFVLKITDADLNNRVPKETWAEWMEDSSTVLGLDKVPWPYAEFPANFGFEKDKRDEWDKVFLIAKHLRVEKREVLVR